MFCFELPVTQTKSNHLDRDMTSDTKYKNSDLPSHSQLLRDQYRIEQQFLQGGFGITYLARDSLDRQVIIKECFPSEICCREGAEVRVRSLELQDTFSSILLQFQCEARRLAALTHPNIVTVHQVFEENGTAYIAMEFVDGADFATIAEVEPERFRPDVLHQMLLQTLEAIQFTHERGILHGDIAPDNLLLDAEDHVTLIDFGAAYEIRKGHNGVRSKMHAVKDGFSPHESYTNRDRQDASSDLYSLGATFYYLITGAPPPDAQARFTAVEVGKPDPYQCLTQGAWGCDNNFLAAIDQALAVFQKDRIKSADEWFELLNSSKTSVPSIAQSGVSSSLTEEAIYQLVSDTNMQLTPGLPEVLKQQMAELQEPEKQNKKPANVKKWVDIFGNPIKDVDAFLREEDRHFRKNQPGRSGQQSATGSKLIVQIPPVRSGKSDEKLRESVIGRMLGGVLPKRRSSNSVIIQT